MNTLSQLFAELDSDPTKAASKPEGGDFAADGCFTNAADAMSFMNGGNATVTFVSKVSEKRFTFKIRKPEDGDGSFLFVSLLNGPDNWTNYAYIGYIRRGVFFHGGKKAKAGVDAPGVKAFTWTHGMLSRGELPASVEVWHEGKCGRCGRLLTVPASVASGFGPECITKMGVL